MAHRLEHTFANQFTMRLKHLIISLLVLGLISLITYRVINNLESNSATEKVPTNRPLASVSAIITKPRTFANQLSLSGSIEANEQVELRSEVSGVVQAISFREGSLVSKGQVLVKVNDIELKAQLIQAKTRENLAKENERRAQLLLQKEAISQEEYDMALADYKSAQAQTQLIQAQISKTQIVAPFSGKIGLRSISVGAYITPATLIAKLVNSKQVKLTFSIPEKYANQMKVDADLKFTIAGSSEIFSASVYAIEPEIAAATRTLQLRALAQNLEGKLIPGTFANISLELEDLNDAIFIPTEAIIPIQNGKRFLL